MQSGQRDPERGEHACFCPADARILEVGVNEEIGNYVRLDLGNGYQAVCGS